MHVCVYICVCTHGYPFRKQSKETFGQRPEEGERAINADIWGRTFQAEEIATEAGVSGVEEEMEGQSEGKDRPRRALWAILGPWLWLQVDEGPQEILCKEGKDLTSFRGAMGCRVETRLQVSGRKQAGCVWKAA